MPDINKPMDVPELNLQPPITGKVRLSEDMQQTLALLCGLAGNHRKLLRASESGILNTITPLIKDLWGHTSTGATEHKQGDDIACSEVMIMGHPDNGDKIWVRPYAQYVLSGDTANIAWPVAANAVVSFTVSNLKQLWFYFVDSGDKIIVAYTQ